MAGTTRSAVRPEALGLRGASVTKELDVTPEEWRALLDLSAQLKRERRERREPHRMAGMDVALVAATTSARTRGAFEVAAHDQGGHVTRLDSSGSRLGQEESVEDTGRVLGRTFDAIVCRGLRQEDVETLARCSGVPVWNGLSDQWHPTQSLCDVFTVEEHVAKPLAEVAVAYVGDARTAVARSLLVAGAMSGVELRMVSPAELATPPEVWRSATGIAEETGARLAEHHDPRDGVHGADVVYTDGWVSTGEAPEERAARLALLRPYRVDEALMLATGNPTARFMHCLPALHDDRATVGADVLATMPGESCLEVADTVFRSPASIVFDQAENRVHAVKAVMVATAGPPRVGVPARPVLLPD